MKFICINGAGHRFQCSAVACWRFRHLFGYLFGTVYATPHGELRRALGNQAHRASLQYPSACPVASRTMKWASVSSAVQDGGKRRGLISSSLLRLGASWQVPSGIGATGAIWRAETLRDDALTTERAGVRGSRPRMSQIRYLAR